MSVDPQKHLEIFSPHAFGKRRVDVVGCGAVGSRVATELARLGIENIHLWDFDSVELKNVPNQAFLPEDVGKAKVDALAAKIEEISGEKNFATVHHMKVDGNFEAGDVVFLLVDTMADRKEIWNGALKMKLRTSLLIETRMGADSGRVYSFNPNKRSYGVAWEETLCDDSETERSACGATVSVGPTAKALAGLAVWQLVRWFAVSQGGKDTLDHEVIFSMRPIQLLTRQFPEI